MEFEFDKEIDALLRQTAHTGEATFANPKAEIQNPKSHLDADEISAFAENALPEKTKTLYTEHFADCDRCRKILSNVISLNSENKPAPAKEIKLVAPAAVSPWYRRLFAAPNLAYAMSALLLIFVGLIAFTFLKDKPRDTEISQAIVSEKPINMSGADSDGETVTTEKSASSASMSNAAAMTNSMQSNSAASRGAFPSAGSSMSNGGNIANSSSEAAKDAAKNKSPKEQPANEPDENQARASNFADGKQPLAEKENDKSVQEDASKPAPPKSAAPLPPPAPSAALSRSAGASSVAAQAKKTSRAETENTETRTVSGKNFRHTGGVWYDVNYSGQTAASISRNSSEFKKLDAGLRSIAETLSGAVVVVWKGKTYRIQ